MWPEGEEGRGGIYFSKFEHEIEEEVRYTDWKRHEGPWELGCLARVSTSGEDEGAKGSKVRHIHDGAIAGEHWILMLMGALSVKFGIKKWPVEPRRHTNRSLYRFPR